MGGTDSAPVASLVVLFATVVMSIMFGILGGEVYIPVYDLLLIQPRPFIIYMFAAFGVGYLIYRPAEGPLAFEAVDSNER